MVIIENMSKSYGGKAVLKNINITFEKGKVYGIAGENGSGKTTFFKCVAGIEKYEGIVKSDFKKLKEHSGFLQTDPYFFQKITGVEYLRLLCNARNIKEINFEEKNIFDLPLDQYAQTYSTGMKKKLALMGILLQNNNFFILDEPFNGVDIQSNILITEIIHKLRSLNKTVVISSHIFSTLNDTCDIIHLQKEGEFIRTVHKDEFSQLESYMKDDSFKNRIDKLHLK